MAPKLSDHGLSPKIDLWVPDVRPAVLRPGASPFVQLHSHQPRFVPFLLTGHSRFKKKKKVRPFYVSLPTCDVSARMKPVTFPWQDDQMQEGLFLMLLLRNGSHAG